MAGNANSGRREKLFDKALRMEIAAAGEDHKKLRAIARAALDKAENGDMQAIQFIAERTDGKVAQAHIGGEDDDPAIAIAGQITLSATGAIVERVARGGAGSASS